MCKRATLFLAAALSAVPPAWAAPAPADGARRKLEDLKKRLPRIVAGWAKERWFDAVEVKSVHLLGPAEAKAHFLCKDVGVKGGRPADPVNDGFFTVYLRYYDGEWTASRFEASWERAAHHKNRALRFLMLAIDAADAK
jgi:hypothetical protein